VEYPGVPGVCTPPVISPYKLHKDFLGLRDSDSGVPRHPRSLYAPRHSTTQTSKDFSVDHARIFWQPPSKISGSADGIFLVDHREVPRGNGDA